MINAYIAPKHRKNEDAIKEKIVDGRTRGVCDRNGVTIPRHKRGAAGKGDRFRHVGKQYYENAEKIFGPPKLNVWPRDKNGVLIDT